MRTKLSQASIRAYAAILSCFTCLAHDLKEDERGTIVETVLLILVAVLAVTMLWGFLSGWLQDMWNKIVNGSNNIK